MGWKTNPKNRAYLSEEFAVAIRRAPQSRRALADVIGVNKTVLDHWLEGVNRVSLDDPRVEKLAETIGFPKDQIHERVAHASS